ncbi:MAG TPA: PTS sugar transporter subunit IIA [bacterium]|nr:PTS sugar transporter subunit IIA [bacterium]
MIGTLIVTHGEFGNALLETLRMILGQTEGILSVPLLSKDSPENLRLKILKGLEQVDPQGKGALILVDMLGGTPFNVGIQLAAERNVKVITGVSLPMLIKVVSDREAEDLTALTRDIQQSARESVVTSVELFDRKK